VEDDLLGPPYQAEVLDLGDDEEGRVIATLIRRRAERPTDRAVLYIHGYVDYFFQTHVADFYTERGWDFYAIDLRKYGRSLLAHQTPNFCRHLEEYYPDLDAAIKVIRDRDHHNTVLLTGHSTGGLTAALWAHDRRTDNVIDGLFLNSPFFDLNVPAFFRRTLAPLFAGSGRWRPYATFPATGSTAYGRSIHASMNGEWDFDLAWKPVPGFKIRAGWLRAVRAGQRRLRHGLAIEVPVLVACSAKSFPRGPYDPAAHHADAVLDVAHIVRWAPHLGRHITLVKFDGGVHDLTLSAAPVRKEVFATVAAWSDAFLAFEDGPRPGHSAQEIGVRP
jgi:alpha-beta hydrolase superfamily lysophospholipase